MQEYTCRKLIGQTFGRGFDSRRLHNTLSRSEFNANYYHHIDSSWRFAFCAPAQFYQGFQVASQNCCQLKLNDSSSRASSFIYFKIICKNCNLIGLEPFRLQFLHILLRNPLSAKVSEILFLFLSKFGLEPVSSSLLKKSIYI